MAILLTGSTGFLGAHVLANLLERHDDELNLLVRNASPERVWRAIQIHMDATTLKSHLASRIHLFDGDLTATRFGLSDADYERLVKTTDSVIHCAATLNRKSEKSCLNVNLRGALEVFLLARRAHEDHGVRRFSHVSTVAVAGERQDEDILEDTSIDWARSDYDPYARTKKFGEHMLHELLPDIPHTVFRPSIVLGDSRRGATTSFDMVRSFVFFAKLWALPLRADGRVDIVPVDYVADAIETLHQKETPDHGIYHLSAGRNALTFLQITEALAKARNKSRPRFLPWLGPPFSGTVSTMARWFRGTGLGSAAARMQVFMPYLTFNTVFDNSRVVAEMDREPTPFSAYCHDLMRYSLEHNFQYPYEEWPK